MQEEASAFAAFVGIDRLATELQAMGLAVPLLLVHSAGGSVTVDEARSVPISLAESGPAAGVAARTLARSASNCFSACVSSFPAITPGVADAAFSR